VKKPKHGFGKNINPCIDCRLLLMETAKKVMKETGATFLITGEVLGSRPMSQRMDSLQIIEKESGLTGLILRPLSAKLLPPTLPEKAGIVDRQKLLDFHGRSRKPQMELAEEIKMTDYPCPAGGCLLTDKDFSKRLKGYLEINQNPTIKEIFLLKQGRHFLIDNYKVIVGRNEADNKMINKLAGNNDIFIKISDFEGPAGLIQVPDAGCQVPAENRLLGLIKKAASIGARYSQGRDETKLDALYWSKDIRTKTISVKPEEGFKLVEEAK
jgi:tRNA-specific 2-thiouridylase